MMTCCANSQQARNTHRSAKNAVFMYVFLLPAEKRNKINKPNRDKSSIYT